MEDKPVADRGISFNVIDGCLHRLHRRRNMFWMLKKFGLSECGLDNLLWNVFWLMKLLTINLDSTTQYTASLLHVVYAVTCLMCYIYVYVFSVAYDWLYLHPHRIDSTSIVILVSLSFASNISTMKLTYMFLQRSKLVKMIDDYRIVHGDVVPDSRFERTMLTRLTAVKKRALVFWCSFVTGSTVYMLFPMVTPGRNLPENSLQIYGLEPMFDTPYYETAYAVTLLAANTATFVPSNVTVLLIVLAGYIEANIAALSTEFRHLWQDVHEQAEIQHLSEFKKRQVINNGIRERLSNLVKRHGETVVLRQRLNALFEGVIAFEFALTMIALCAVLLGGLENTALQIPYTIIQLVVDSLIGQRLLDSGEDFEKAVYECGWEHFSPSDMRTVQVVLQCAQAPLRLTAGGITTLCYESFMAITKSVYSAYATLSNTMSS